MRFARLIAPAVMAAAFVAVAAFVPTPATAAPDGWHTSIDDGREASAKSGRPLLVVTAWKEKV